MDRTSGTTAHATHKFLKSSQLQGRTNHGQETKILNGMLVTKPFATSDKPFGRNYPTAVAFGSIDPILNNPTGPARTSHARSTHSLDAVTHQSAGATHKTLLPYSPEAKRNKLDNEPKRGPKPFATTISLEAQDPRARNGKPFETTSEVMQRPAALPLSERVGAINNPGIAAVLTKRLHSTMYPK